ncbi:MAG: methyl-accepting chemotaxis protein [Lachnospiraceae bacterium]|nr:methyl-accepting chemotaxis protein [Lachnospiraceae bacterium]MDD7333370.1 methyl-accepting chemotaxis protein [Lachnospiraceae bacterium]MDY5101473.1 methyl-accepting chemotaxis protein [Agathobacter sp.]MDY5522067.1 methyl-accepting chemotaxis protein [Agathobacter sp.]
MQNKFGMTLKKKILSMILLPVLVLGLVVIILSMTVIKGALIREVRLALQSVATATYAAYDQNSGDYVESTNGDVWKGGFNISKSDSIVDTIKEKSGVEVTFFYGDRRIMTSAKDKDGNRILGSRAGDVIVEKVLNGGQEYFSKNVSIDGTLYYGYYVPVYQSSGAAPVGMVFVGAQKSEKDAVINQIVYAIVFMVVFLMAACMLLGFIFASSLSRSLKKSIGAVQSVATGNLRTPVDEKLLKQKDEVGDLTRGIKRLQDEMTRSIEFIASNSKAVLEASGALETTAKETTSSMREVENSMNDIAQSASQQAKISGDASVYVAQMGEKIEQTSREVDELKMNAEAMRESEEETAATMGRLLESNSEVDRLIREIAQQTKQTNESAQKIKEATDIIASIAEETSLLSLNASIEAARAGENGRGFAVVAEQIQKLAQQSDESSKKIDEIIRQLIEDSDRTVGTMEQVMSTVFAQTEHMQQTSEKTQEVRERLGVSLDSMAVIEESVAYLNKARQEIVRTVQELSDIAKQNAATTQEVCATVNLVTEGFGSVEGSTEDLRSIADGLEDSMGHFSV